MDYQTAVEAVSSCTDPLWWALTQARAQARAQAPNNDEAASKCTHMTLDDAQRVENARRRLTRGYYFPIIDEDDDVITEDDIEVIKLLIKLDRANCLYVMKLDGEDSSCKPGMVWGDEKAIEMMKEDPQFTLHENQRATINKRWVKIGLKFPKDKALQELLTCVAPVEAFSDDYSYDYQYDDKQYQKGF